MDSVLLESHSFIHRPLEPFWNRVKAEKDPLVLEQNPKRGMLEKSCAGVSICSKLSQVRSGFSKYSRGVFIVGQGDSASRFSLRFLSIMRTLRIQKQPSCIHKSQLCSWPKKGGKCIATLAIPKLDSGSADHRLHYHVFGTNNFMRLSVLKFEMKMMMGSPRLLASIRGNAV